MDIDKTQTAGQVTTGRYIACVKILETIKPNNKRETINVVHLVPPTDSPGKRTKETILMVTKEVGNRKDQEK